MEEVMIFVQEKLPIIIAYMLVLAECVGQVFLKKFTKKYGREQQSFVVEKMTYVDKENIKLTAEVVAVRKENASLKRRIEKLEMALASIIEEDTK